MPIDSLIHILKHSTQSRAEYFYALLLNAPYAKPPHSRVGNKFAPNSFINNCNVQNKNTTYPTHTHTHTHRQWHTHLPFSSDPGQSKFPMQYNSNNIKFSTKGDNKPALCSNNGLPWSLHNPSTAHSDHQEREQSHSKTKMSIKNTTADIRNISPQQIPTASHTQTESIFRTHSLFTPRNWSKEGENMYRFSVYQFEQSIIDCIDLYKSTARK